MTVTSAINRDVAGSSPAIHRRLITFSGVAQLVERL